MRVTLTIALSGLLATAPAAYAARLAATHDRLCNPDQLSRSHVALPAPRGAKCHGALIAAG